MTSVAFLSVSLVIFTWSVVFLPCFDFVCLVVCFRFVKDNQEFKRGLLKCSFQHFCFNFCKGSELSASSSGSEVLLDMTFKSFIHHSTDHLILPKLSRVQTFRHLSNPLGLACVQPSPPLKKNLEEFLFPMFFRGWGGCTPASWVFKASKVPRLSFFI